MEPSVNSSNSSVHPFVCMTYRTGTFIFAAWLIFYILLLPIFVSVLYIGCQRWRKQRSVSTTVAISHSDVFTFHIVAVEMINIVGSCVFCRGMFSEAVWDLMVGGSIIFMSLNGQMYFHVLTCVERYLAVVHPITYQNLKRRGGVKIRNVSIGFVWLLTLGLLIQSHVFTDKVAELFSILFWWSVSAVVVFFCNFSVLYVLIRPRPGEVGRDVKQINHSKRRTLFTMTAIIGALLLKILILFASMVLFSSTSAVLCVLGLFSLWGHLPSSLVLPLLFLHRAAKLPGCKQTNKTLSVKFAHHCTLPYQQKSTST